MADEEKTIEIKVGEEVKVLKADEVLGLIKANEELAGGISRAKGVMAAADKYGVEPEIYLENAESAFRVVQELMDKGLIGSDGKVIEKKLPQDSNDPRFKEIGTFQTNKLSDPALEGMAKKLKTIEEALGTIAERQQRFDKDQTNMIRMDLERQVTGKHPLLDSEDVARVMGLAMSDRRKSLWQHAEEYEVGKKERLGLLERQYAEKFGINLDEWNANKLNEQGSGGGGAALFKGKTISFRAKEGDKDAITPKKAMIEFFRRQQARG